MVLQTPPTLQERRNVGKPIHGAGHGFSAALITSLGNDTVAAANYAEMAMVDMSDNANTFGTDMESIQWAYQGSRSRITRCSTTSSWAMAGTKEEMQRLISDASKMTDVQKKLGVTVDESSLSFDNIVAAIHVMQTSMQISGITRNKRPSWSLAEP